jgi:hypothetical protein
VEISASGNFVIEIAPTFVDAHGEKATKRAKRAKAVI